MVIWRKAMWKVHVVDLGKLFKICRIVKISIHNLTRCKQYDSNSDKTKIFQFKIMLFTKTISFKIMLFREKFFFKIMLLKKFFFFKIVLFKYARKTQNLRILRGKMSQNVIFCVQTFFKMCFLKVIFSSKSCFLKVYFSSKSCFSKLGFSLKSDAS